MRIKYTMFIMLATAANFAPPLDPEDDWPNDPERFHKAMIRLELPEELDEGPLERPQPQPPEMGRNDEALPAIEERMTEEDAAQNSEDEWCFDAREDFNAQNGRRAPNSSELIVTTPDDGEISAAQSLFRKQGSNVGEAIFRGIQTQVAFTYQTWADVYDSLRYDPESSSRKTVKMLFAFGKRKPCASVKFPKHRICRKSERGQSLLEFMEILKSVYTLEGSQAKSPFGPGIYETHHQKLRVECGKGIHAVLVKNGEKTFVKSENEDLILSIEIEDGDPEKQYPEPVIKIPMLANNLRTLSWSHLQQLTDFVRSRLI